MATQLRSRKDSEDDSDGIIFEGPIRKYEMISILKYYDLLSSTYLEPLSKFQNTDVLDEDLLTQYWNIFEIRSLENDELDNPARVLEKSRHNNELESLEIEESLEGSLNNESQWTDLQLSEEVNTDDSSIILIDLCDSKTESMEAVQYEDKITHSAEEDENCSKNSVQCNDKSIATIKVENSEMNQILQLEKEIIDLTINDSLDSMNSTADNLDVSTFNDTLEEMEMFIKYGENYMQKKEDNTVESEKLETPEVENNSPIEEQEDEENKENITKVTSSSTFKQFNNEYKRQQPLSSTEKMKIINNKTPQKTPHLKQPNSQFKIPVNKPLSARKSPNYKNIVSPIGLYIRNSPQVPLVQKVSAPTNHASTFKDPNAQRTSCETELDIAGSSSGLPTRSYKPSSRNILISKENEPSMPCSVRKLIKGSLGPEIIKHVRRIKNSEDLPTTPTQTVHNDTEFTILSSTAVSENSFHCNASTDVSLYISKNSIKKYF